MTASIENIVQHLFHQPSLQTVSVDELQQMTQEHPSFAAARFLLLKKMQETGHPDFTSQLHKTTVYFNNPLWLQLLLSPTREEAGAWRPSNGAPTEMIEHGLDLSDDSPAETLANAEATEEDSNTTAPPKAKEKLYIKQIDEPLIEEVLARLRGQINDAGDLSSTDKNENPLVREVLNRLRRQINEAGHLPAIDQTAQDSDPLVQEVLNRLRQQISEAGDLPPIDKTARIEDPLVQEVLDRLRAQIHQARVQQQPETETPVSSAQPGFPAPDPFPAQDDQPKEEDFAPIPDTEPASAATPVITDAEGIAPDSRLPAPDSVPASVDPSADLSAIASAKAEAPAKADTPKIIIETPMAQNDVLFEPYHTIDYFASQGIRLDKIEPVPKDRLGRQLKSFTEWLKSMKKLPQASIEKVLAENEESAVVAAASHSVEGKDVITEAMAEVFEKQGLHDKAIEVYRKLSLLNPAKSAYFADRINELKHP